MLVIEVPTKPYVKKFLEIKYGNPAFITRDSRIGKYFYQLLTSDDHQRDCDFSRYKTTLTVQISEDFMYRKGFGLTRTNIIYFNNFVEESIKEKLFTFLDVRLMNHEMKIKYAIDEFLSYEGLNENFWDYHSIQKAYKRYRDGEKSRLKQKKSLGEVSDKIIPENEQHKSANNRERLRAS